MRGQPHRARTDWALLGLRRVSWVRIVLTDGGVARAEVAGLGHRLPVVRSVPLATATSLAASGVPTVVRRCPSPTVPDGRLSLPSRH